MEDLTGQSFALDNALTRTRGATVRKNLIEAAMERVEAAATSANVAHLHALNVDDATLYATNKADSNAASPGQDQPVQDAVTEADVNAGEDATHAETETAPPSHAEVVLSQGSSSIVVLGRDDSRKEVDDPDAQRQFGSESLESPAGLALLDFDTEDDFLVDLASRGPAEVIDAEGAASVVKVAASQLGSTATKVFGFDNVAGAADGDRIDLSDILSASGFDPLSDALSNFVRIQTDAAGNVAVGIDTTGAGTAFTDVLVLQAGGTASNGEVPNASGLAGASLDQMLNDNILIV